VHLLALASSFVPVPVVQPAADYYAVAPATEFLGRAVVVMNTQYGDPAVANYVKRDKKSGRSNLLKGYTVGSRAPTTSIRSGTTAVRGYGISNLYGGGRKTQTVRGASNTLLGGAGASYKKTAFDPSGLGPIFCWVGLIIVIGSYFKYAS
jgi:hypothetical protein